MGSDDESLKPFIPYYYQAATQLYTRSLGLWRTAIGK